MHSRNKATHHRRAHVHTAQTSQAVIATWTATDSATAALANFAGVPWQLLELKLRFHFFLMAGIHAINHFLQLGADRTKLIAKNYPFLLTLSYGGFGHS